MRIGRADVLSRNAGSLYGANGACIGRGLSFLIFVFVCAELDSDFARALLDFVLVLDFVWRAAIGRSEKCPLPF
jgi:hypothetical protein